MHRFRPGRPADLPALTALYNHFVTETHVTFDVGPFTVGKRRAWFEKFHTRGPHRLVVALDGERLEGYACSGPLRDKTAYATSVEVSVYVLPTAQGRGLGRALYRSLFQLLATEDVHRAYGGVALPNPASERLHLATGFAPLGTYHEVGRKFGRYWSVKWFEKRLPRALGR